MLNRKQIAASIADQPRCFDEIYACLGDLRRNLPPSVSGQFSDDELRQRLAQESVVCWFESCDGEENPFPIFMRALSFDWADVRELKAAHFDPSLAAFRSDLLAKATLHHPDDAETAMRLVEHWFDCAEQEHGDNADEFAFANVCIMDSMGGRIFSDGIVIEAVMLRSLSVMVSRAIIASFLTSFMSVLLGSFLFQSVTVVLTVTNVVSLVSILIHRVRLSRRIATIFSPADND